MDRDECAKVTGNYVTKATLRQRINYQIEDAKNQIRILQNGITERQAALKTLDSNKNLETIINLLESRY